MKDAVVIGLGNPLLSDEGVGIRVIERMRETADRFPEADFLDAGTSGMVVLHAVAGRRRAILVDCAFMGDTPGTIRRFLPSDVRSRKPRGALSAHGGDPLALLRLSAELGEAPGRVVLFGIEPETVASGQALSPRLQGRLDEYVGAIADELRGKGTFSDVG